MEVHMATPEVTEYIRAARESGATDSSIREALLKVGWAEDAIAQGLVSVTPSQAFSLTIPEEPVVGGEHKRPPFPWLALVSVLVIASVLAGVYYFSQQSNLKEEAYTAVSATPTVTESATATGGSPVPGWTAYTLTHGGAAVVLDYPPTWKVTEEKTGISLRSDGGNYATVALSTGLTTKAVYDIEVDEADYTKNHAGTTLVSHSVSPISGFAAVQNEVKIGTTDVIRVVTVIQLDAETIIRSVYIKSSSEDIKAVHDKIMASIRRNSSL